jgi:ribulose-5-phosphate 4-epimerase/fuculose-1-phosphate aldolase
VSIADDLVDLGRRLVELGLSRGTAGNISVCTQEGDMVASPSGTDLGALRPDGLSRLSRADDGTLRQVAGPKASKEMPLHAAMYRRSGPGVVVHTHSFHAMQSSCLPPWSEHCAIPPHAPYFAMKIGNCPLIPYRHPGDPELGTLIDELDLEFRAALLAHHGLVLAAATVDEAIAATVELEEACRLAVGFAQNPRARALPPEAVAELAERNGRPWGPRIRE